MAFISKFCFSCSVRLGSVITGVLTLVQASALLGVTLMGADSLSIDQWVDTLHLEGQFYKEIARNPRSLTTTVSTFLCCLMCSCVSLLYGCFQHKTFFMYPFVVLYLVYILGLLMALILLVLLIKVRGNGLGDLILYANLGGFVLLFYLYTWVCVVSLVQIIAELKERLKKKLNVSNTVKLYNNTRGFHNHAQFNQ